MIRWRVPYVVHYIVQDLAKERNPRASLLRLCVRSEHRGYGKTKRQRQEDLIERDTSLLQAATTYITFACIGRLSIDHTRIIRTERGKTPAHNVLCKTSTGTSSAQQHAIHFAKTRRPFSRRRVVVVVIVVASIAQAIHRTILTVGAPGTQSFLAQSLLLGFLGFGRGRSLHE